jgi:hypothetical protein
MWVLRGAPEDAHRKHQQEEQLGAREHPLGTILRISEQTRAVTGGTWRCGPTRIAVDTPPEHEMEKNELHPGKATQFPPTPPRPPLLSSGATLSGLAIISFTPAPHSGSH